MSAAARVALATATEAVGRDEDEPLLIAALGAVGIRAVPVVWDDPGARWQDHDLVLVRSTWDYTDRLADFLEWAEQVERETVLHNPARVLRWNTDKRYLAELSEDGVHVAPTAFLDPSDTTATGRVGSVVHSVAAHGDVVVKPAVSAGSRDTERHDRTAVDAAEAHVRRLLAQGRVAMVQPYLERVDTRGETGMVFLGGELSHTFRKAPLLLEGRAPVDGLFAPERITARVPDEAELALAAHTIERALARCGVESLLYARVDVLADDGGRPTLLELELTEPSWFLAQAPEAAQRAAAAIAALL
jgi:O-ureido-D-serine cyclo-ligase